MKKTSFSSLLMIGAIAATIFIAGCKKENSDTLSAQEEEQAATYASESETQSEIIFNDVFDNVMGVNSEVGTGGTGIFGRVASAPNGREMGVDSVPSCVTITIVPLAQGVFPKTVTLDFGSGCYSHGHLRSGKIRTVYTGRLVESGNSATTTFDNYKIDSVSVEGTHKITNTTGSTAGANQKQYKIEVTDGKLTKPNTDYFQWNAVRTITQTEGNGTVIAADDIFKVTGVANGKVKRGILIFLWNSEITEPLIKKYICSWISKGTIRVVRQGLAATSPWVGILDYGAGTCDNAATLTINGTSHQITLH